MSGWDEAMPLYKTTPMTGVFAALAAFATDQVTKAIVVANDANLIAGIPVFPGFNLVFHRNDGVTFGMLSGAPWWSLIALALVRAEEHLVGDDLALLLLLLVVFRRVRQRAAREERGHC